ncbi:MAG: hypothetical protein LBM60_03955, partial [Clostridium sp.]|nr:hypothetical protein [Clostridium sp.]
MSHNSFRWMFLGALQHLMFGLLSALIAYVMFHMQVRIQYEPNVYYTVRVNFLTTDPSFEDSEAFSYWTENAINRIAEEIVLRDTFETNGLFDPAKPIDVTAFIKNRRIPNPDDISVTYHIRDLLAWAETGIRWEQVELPLREFLEYFDPQIFSVNHFYLNENQDLCFSQTLQKHSVLDSTKVKNAIEKLPEQDLNYLVYEQLRWSFNWNVSLKTRDENQVVLLQKLVCESSTTRGSEDLIDLVDDWPSLFELQKNVEAAVFKMQASYDAYRRVEANRIESNVIYAAKIGETFITNQPSHFQTQTLDEIDDFFTKLAFYAQCWVSSIMGASTNDYDSYLYNAILETGYDYGEDASFWVGVELSYPLAEDSLFDALSAYDFLEYRQEILIIAGILCVIWLAALICVTIHAKHQGEKLALESR